MESVGAPSPEFNRCRLEPVTAPVWRPWDFFPEPTGKLFKACLQRLTVFGHLALSGGPRAQARAHRPAAKIGVRFLGRGLLHGTFDTHLLLHWLPVEYQAGAGVC